MTERESRQAIVVLGMHRSGTSALAGSLHALGIPLGEPLLPPNFANERGYWELAEAVAIHDDLLSRLGAAVMEEDRLPAGWVATPEARRAQGLLVGLLRRQFEGTSLWAIKDPRMCVLLPLWKDVFDEIGVSPRYVVMLRPAADVARSLEKRDGLPALEALATFHRYSRDAERHTRGERRIVTTFDRLLGEPEAELSRIAEALDVTWPRAISDASPEIREFLDPSLRHWKESVPDAPREVLDAIDPFEEALLELVGSESASTIQRLDAAEAALASALSRHRPIVPPADLDALRADAAIPATRLSDAGFSVEWLSVDVPETSRRASPVPVRLRLRNAGAERWPSLRATDPAAPGVNAVRLAYRFLRDDRTPHHDDYGTRVELPLSVYPGETIELKFRVPAPRDPGAHRLQIDLVQEGVSWFESKGAPRLVVPIRVES